MADKLQSKKDWLQAEDMRHATIHGTLAEIYLLIDNITSALNKSLPDIRGLSPTELTKATPPAEWLPMVCSIEWPPEDKAKDDASAKPKNQPVNSKLTEPDACALLFQVRDALNQHAFPATGLSIAFTQLVAGDRDGDKETEALDNETTITTANPLIVDPPRASTSWFRWPWNQNRKSVNRASPPRTGTSALPETNRSKLARIAFPHLSAKVAISRHLLFTVIPILMASMFALTLAMSFDATRGTAMASHLESLIAAKTKIIDDLGKADLTKTVQLPKDRQEFDPINAMILKHNKIAFDITVSQANLHEWARCNVLLFWCSAKIWSSTYPHGSVDPYNLDQALGTLSALVTIVLPALYGALGAMAGQIRETYQRVKQNTLMPRHAMLFFTPWLLGCVAGGTVGLFFAPSGADAGTAGGLTNSLKLAPSALSFLAGFSAESVFEQLDGLVRRVFGRDTTPTPPAK